MSSNFAFGGGYNTTLPPGNSGLSDLAQTKLDGLVARAVARHLQALRVDGNILHLYNKTRSGPLCTCNTLNSRVRSTPNTLAPPPETPPPAPADGDFRVVRIRGDKLAQPASVDTAGERWREVGSITTDEAGALLESRNDLLGGIIDGLSDQDLAQYVSGGNGAIVGGDKQPCGICFGTGHTDGYSLVNGQRLVLDSTDSSGATLHGASVNSGTAPNSFELSTNKGYVAWPVELPLVTSGWLGLLVRDNLQPARGVDVQYCERGREKTGEWSYITLDVLRGFEGKPKNWTIRAVRNSNLGSGETATFTHVELLYMLGEPLIGQAPQVNSAANMETDGPLISTQFEIAATVPSINRESLFTDSKHKQLWKITDVTTKTTSSGLVFSYDVNARMVQRGESLYALRGIYDPLVMVNYRGLEVIQGGSRLHTPPGRLSNSIILEG